MVVVNTNIAALRSGEAMRQAESAMGDAMERLSTGLRINSAADDAAGSAIASKMEAQTRSLVVAIRNANDAISLTQTAEGALGEVEDILQRMRELAVQGGNSTLNASDRAQIQIELDQLAAEIDEIADKTNFNNVKLLDGTNTSVSFQTGINADSNVSVALEKASAAALGLAGSIGGVNRLTSERLTNSDMSAVVTTDVKINGQNWSAANGGDYSGGGAAAGLKTLINNNTAIHGAKATAFNSLTSGPVGDFNMTTSFTINSATIDVVNSYEELVDEINQEATGVSAVLNGDNSITLFNDDGADIAIGDTQGATDVGFTRNKTYLGMIALENVDGSAVSIEIGVVENGYVGDTGAGTDLSLLGFNTVRNGVVTGGSVTNADLEDTDGVKINGVAIGGTSASSAAVKAAKINETTSLHGVVATAKTELRLTVDFSTNGGTNNAVLINGSAVDLSSANDTAQAVSAINGVANLGGDIVASSDSSGKLVLTSNSGATITVAEDADHQAFFTAGENLHGDAYTEASHVYTALGSVILTSQSGGHIKLEDATSTPGDGLAKLGLQGASVAEEVTGTGVNVATSASAGAALTAVDAAINKVGDFRASFGAYENRFEKAINNLTTYKVNLEAAKGRIEDADFASETAALTKSQILNQAATSMLAQANASKQNLLALLQ
ncbi:MAG: flagellin [Candidatus Micropelagos thuwalensis]